MGENNEEIGCLEYIHGKVQEVFVPVPFVGGRFIINKGLSPNFQVNHTLAFGNGEQSGYKFGATFVGHNKISENEPNPILMGEIQPNGSLQASIISSINENIKLKYLAQIQNNIMIGQKYALEMRHDAWQTCVTIINPDINKYECMSVIDVMKRVSSSIFLGSMLVCSFSPNLPSYKEAHWTVGGKYMTENWQTSLSVRPLQASLHASFYMRVKGDLHFAGEIETNYPQQTSVASVGYQYEIPKSGLVWKSQIDSNANIVSSFEKRLFPFPLSFTICSISSLIKGKCDFGIGLTLG